MPIGFAKSSAGEYTFSIFAVVGIALIVSWFVAVMFAPLLGVVMLAKPKHARPSRPSRILGAFRWLLVGAMRARWITIGVTVALLRRGVAAVAADPAAVLSAVRPAGAAGRSQAAAERLDLRHRRSRRQRLDERAEDRSRRRAAGAPMSVAARSASICRSLSNCPTISSPRR